METNKLLSIGWVKRHHKIQEGCFLRAEPNMHTHITQVKFDQKHRFVHGICHDEFLLGEV